MKRICFRQAFYVFLSAILFAVLCQVAFAGNMTHLFLQHGDFEKTPLPKEAAASYAKGLSLYLLGVTDSFTVEYENTDYSIYFSEEEVLHLKDVRNIFLWMEAIFFACFILSVFHWKKHAHVLCKQYYQYLIGLAVFLLITIGIAVLTALHFDEMFIFMHRILFSNEHWLLTPGVDVIISLMPLPFFMDMAKNIAIVFVLFVTVYSFLIRICRIS